MAPVLEPWCSEPVDLEALVDTYVVEGKFAARTPGATLYLVHAKTRSGDRVERSDAWTALQAVHCPPAESLKPLTPYARRPTMLSNWIPRTMSVRTARRSSYEARTMAGWPGRTRPVLLACLWLAGLTIL